MAQITSEERARRARIHNELMADVHKALNKAGEEFGAPKAYKRKGLAKEALDAAFETWVPISTAAP